MNPNPLHRQFLAVRVECDARFNSNGRFPVFSVEAYAQSAEEPVLLRCRLCRRSVSRWSSCSAIQSSGDSRLP